MESRQFKDLQDENKDLVLAAAHIEDAKSGRYEGCMVHNID